MFTGFIVAAMVLYGAGVLTGVFIGYQIHKEIEKTSQQANGGKIKGEKGEK